MENKEIDGVLGNLIGDFQEPESALKNKLERGVSENFKINDKHDLPPCREAYLLDFNEAAVNFEVNMN